jgi:hypothetical protein
MYRRPIQIVGNHFNRGSAPGHSGFLLSNGVFRPIEIGEEGSSVWGINIHGDIVGLYGSANVTHGFALRNGNLTQIDYPGAVDFGITIPSDINDVGDVVGWYSVVSGWPEHGFLLREGVYTTIDYPGAFATNVRGINSEGDMVGLYTMNNNPDSWTDGPFCGFLLKRNGTFTTIMRRHPDSVYCRRGVPFRRHTEVPLSGEPGCWPLYQDRHSIS